MPREADRRRLQTATVVSHVGFEDLGILAPLLAERDISIGHIDAPRDPLQEFDATSPDLLIVLGGPIGVYEIDAYPFLSREIAMVGERLARGLRTLGICLGAQLMAAALGARVYPSGIKEIGWKPVALSDPGRDSCLVPLAQGELPVLHWHGDTFDLPDGAVHLASTDLCENQAFLLGANALGLQFHLETTAEALESWLVGHAVEIAAAGLSPAALREDSRRLAGACNAAGRSCFAAWLDGLSL